MVYRVSSRTARVMQRNPVSKNKTRKADENFMLYLKYIQFTVLGDCSRGWWSKECIASINLSPDPQHPREVSYGMAWLSFWCSSMEEDTEESGEAGVPTSQPYVVANKRPISNKVKGEI